MLPLPKIIFCSAFMRFSCSFLIFCRSSSIRRCSSIISKRSSAYLNAKKVEIKVVKFSAHFLPISFEPLQFSYYFQQEFVQVLPFSFSLPPIRIEFRNINKTMQFNGKFCFKNSIEFLYLGFFKLLDLDFTEISNEFILYNNKTEKNKFLLVILIKM